MTEKNLIHFLIHPEHVEREAKDSLKARIAKETIDNIKNNPNNNLVVFHLGDKLKNFNYNQFEGHKVLVYGAYHGMLLSGFEGGLTLYKIEHELVKNGYI